MFTIRSLRAISLAALLACSVGSHADRLLDIDTYLALEGESGITISPDGDYLAYTRYWRDLEDDSWRSAIWINPTEGGEPLRGVPTRLVVYPGEGHSLSVTS